MPERRRLDERVAALERRLETAGQVSNGAVEERVTQQASQPNYEALAERVEELEETIADLEAGLAALRGYVGSIDHVNESVERRADAALAAVERLEAAPKTPPPIATAGPETADVSGAGLSETDSGDADPDGEAGLLDRVTDLR